jgi:son of sevenless
MVLEEMGKLMGSRAGFLEYRVTLSQTNPPCIPFFGMPQESSSSIFLLISIGIYLTDFVFIQDGYPSYTNTGLINFRKQIKMAEAFRNTQKHKITPYRLQPVPELQEYLLSKLQEAEDVDEIYDRSLEIEPQEPENEKIAKVGNRSVSC